jgi:hypothetical protein
MFVKISVFAGVTAATFALTESPIVGKWKGETFAAGSTAEMTLDMFGNGTYARRVVATTEFGWTLDGSTLLLAPAIIGPAGEISYGRASGIHVVLAGDSLVASSGGQSMTLHRVTWPVKDAPLLGRWEGHSELNEGITQDFTADGRLIVAVTLSREAGRYTLDDGMINWEEQIPQPARKRSRYMLAEGRLKIFISPRLPPVELSKVGPDSTSVVRN